MDFFLAGSIIPARTHLAGHRHLHRRRQHLVRTNGRHGRCRPPPIHRPRRERMATDGLGFHRDHRHHPAPALPARGHLHDAGVPRIPLQHAHPRHHGHPHRGHLRRRPAHRGALHRGHRAQRHHRHRSNRRLDHRTIGTLYAARRTQGHRLCRPHPRSRPA
jgi:hypothetical protein